MSSDRRGGPLHDLPLPALYFAAAGLWIVVRLVFHSGSVTPVTIVTSVIGGLLFAAIITAVTAVNRRRLGGAGQVTVFTRALRTGTLPADADTTRWPEELDRLDRTRLRRALVPVALTALPIGLGIWGLTDPDARPIAIVLLLVFVALDLAAVALVPIQRRRVERLRQKLAQQ